MATNTEHIKELFQLVSTLTERVDSLRGEVKDASPLLDKVKETIHALETKIAVIEPQFAEMKHWKDTAGLHELKTDVAALKAKAEAARLAAEKWWNRIWSLAPNSLGAIINVVLTCLVTIFVMNKINQKPSVQSDPSQNTIQNPPATDGSKSALPLNK